MTYTLFTIDGCARCIKVKKILEGNEISYIEKNILQDLDARNELKELVDEIITPVLVNKECNEVLNWNQLQSMYN